MVLHQDNAPSHFAKDKISYMKGHNINIIIPHEWLPNSPDAAPMDYLIWSVMKERVSLTKSQSTNTERTKKCYKS